MKLYVLCKIVATVICCAAITLAMVGTADASIQKYRLHNHPDGEARAPLYGLRLDNFKGIVIPKEVYTFSFDEPGTSMFLTYDDVANTINISGTAFGGLDVGGAYSATNSGFWAIDFTYTTNVSEVALGLSVAPESPANNKGTIEFVSGSGWTAGETFNLVDEQGMNAYSFQFLADGFRIPGDNSTLVGVGWVTHDGDGDLDFHNKSSDWIFTGELIPEPATICVWSGLAMIAGVALRRRLKYA